MTAKTQTFRIILKDHSTKREIVFEHLNRIRFVTWSVSKAQRLKFTLYLCPVRRLLNYIFVVHDFSQIGAEFLWNVQPRLFN